MYKKLRFSLISLLVMLCGSVFAEDMTSTFTSNKWAVGDGEPAWTASVDGTALDTQNERGVQFGKNKGSMTLTSVDSFTEVTKVVVVASSNGDEGKLNVSMDNGAIGEELYIEKGTANKNKEYVFEINNQPMSGNIVISIAEGDHSVWIKSITVTATSREIGEVAEKVATPVITPNGGEFTESVEVTISCATEGATIKYCLENEWFNYTEPLTLTESALVAAYAICEGMDDSETVRAQFTKKEQQENPTNVAALFDFTSNTWRLPEDSDNKTVDRKTYSNGTYDIILEGSTGNGYYYNTKDGYLLLGKKGASLTLPAFDFDVEKIEVTGSGKASTKVTQNIFVGEDPVSTETTGAKDVTHVYLISEHNQDAGTNYTLKVTSDHNTQITKIAIYKKGEGGEVAEKVPAPVFTPNGGEFEDSVDVTLSCSSESASIHYAVATDANPDWQLYCGDPIRLKESTELIAYAVCDGMEDSEFVRATFTKKVPVQLFTVDEAIRVIDGMEDKAITKDSLDVEGYVVSITEVSLEFGNATYLIADQPGDTEHTLTIFRGYNLGNVKFTAENQLTVGDKVVVRGKLQRYVSSDGVMTPEMVKGNYLVSREAYVAPVTQTATPVFSPNGGKFVESVDVTLTCETENSKIFYAMASATTDLEWVEYTEPITLTESADLVAYATCEGLDDSEQVRAAFQKVDIEVVDSIGAFIALEANTVAKLNLNNNVQVVFAQKSGNYEYVVVQDDTKARMIMYNLGLTDKVKANDILTGSIIGKYSLYNGVAEMLKDNDLTDISTITATEGTAIKVDQLASVDKAFDPYKHLKLCKISKVSLDGTTASDETGSIQVYDYFKVGYTLPQLEEGQTLNITGIIIPFDKGNAGQITYEIAPISQEAIEVVEAVVGDVNNDGEVGIGDIVAITNVMAGITNDEAVKKAADVNGDGEVGIGDIVAITNIMAGITTEPATNE